jgi:DNA-binding GntR family transcriptional regulator
MNLEPKKMNLTEHIEKDISTHLSLGSTPCRMTVAALAAHYDVSPTPIQIVLARLLEDGKISKQANGRIEVSKNLIKIKTKTDIKPKDDPYVGILREIVQRSLHAEDDFLREETTAANHGLSRSAVREICHTIAGKGLLEHIPRRGWRIRPFSQDDLRDYMETRVVLELKALDLAWGKLLDVDLQSMIDGNIPAQSPDDFPTIDNRLHNYIIERSESFYIKDFFKRHAPFFKILFEWEGEDRDAAIETVKQHHDILKALLNRDKPTAAAALSNHILNNHLVLENLNPVIQEAL